MKHIHLALLALLATILLAAPVCGSSSSGDDDDDDDDDSTKAQLWTVSAGAQTADSSIMGMSMFPRDLAVHRGDSVLFVFRSGEPHTVTIGLKGDKLSQGLLSGADTDGSFMPSGGNVFTGDFLNSGWQASTTWLMKIDAAPGVYKYRCFLHSQQHGYIVVLPDTMKLPYSPREAAKIGAEQAAAALEHGETVLQWARYIAYAGLDLAAPGIEVVAGAGDEQANLMRFVPEELTIKAGQSVTFVNRDPWVPHSVTFGTTIPQDYGVAPYGDNTAYGGGDLNSGWLWPEQIPLTPAMRPSAYTVTFTKAGRYEYICALHDKLGMVGVVIVE